jgi:hypothetical protein
VDDVGKRRCRFSTFERLRSAIDEWLDPINVGIVRYGNKDITGYNLINFLFIKQSDFFVRKRLRVLLQCHDPMAGANRQYDINNVPHAEPLEANKIHEWFHASAEGST